MGNGRSAVATRKREEPSGEGHLSARRKADAVVRLLRGESLDELSRELRVDEFLARGIEGLKARPLPEVIRSLHPKAVRRAGRAAGALALFRLSAIRWGRTSCWAP